MGLVLDDCTINKTTPRRGLETWLQARDNNIKEGGHFSKRVVFYNENAFKVHFSSPNGDSELC